MRTRDRETYQELCVGFLECYNPECSISVKGKDDSFFDDTWYVEKRSFGILQS